MTKRPITRKITIKLNPTPQRTNQDKPKQDRRYIDSNLPSQENDIDSTNSGSMHFPLNNNKNENDNSIDNKTEFNDNQLKETPHFFPIVNNEERRHIPKPKSTRGIRAYKSKEKVTLPKIIDEKIVNKEISNLFENIPDDLVNDPDVKQKVNVLLNNIKEVKNVIYKKKNIQNKKNLSSAHSKREINSNVNSNNINESLIQQIKPYNYNKVHKVRGYANNY